MCVRYICVLNTCKAGGRQPKHEDDGDDDDDDADGDKDDDAANEIVQGGMPPTNVLRGGMPPTTMRK